VVFDAHDVAGLESRIDAAGSVGHDEGLHTQFAHDPNGKGHPLHGVAFVEVDPSMLEDDLMAL